jgi:hypothetical protein
VEFPLRRSLCSCSKVKQIRLDRKGAAVRTMKSVVYPMSSSSWFSVVCKMLSFWGSNFVVNQLSSWPCTLYNLIRTLYLTSMWWVAGGHIILLNMILMAIPLLNPPYHSIGLCGVLLIGRMLVIFFPLF